ncbi:3-ketoacyl-CoA reductase [Laetiporus sulphureus 93-53]|uniref:Very-long-chain 3-oxoacyl-CoA reductase n=1 Tax=Laetiporus sulphureus 93-53 TaxID=1314785 RepID=A0A165F6W5_9APHY|nr:3-ketoacyl-CoA reductase [Laetiporus sulphureus 93-53]KZT08503.1 3-ketoacyl-CoA reductase [Laetiporus sulphureus 93-53]
MSTMAVDHPYVVKALLALGAISFAKFAIKSLGVLLQTFVLSGNDLRKYGAGKGAWAVVTGASEGIGREFALQLAKKGFNVFVSARNAGALAALVAEIEQAGSGDRKVKAKSVIMDFSQLSDQAQWTRFENEVKGLDVGVLVNNVGRSHKAPIYFAEADTEEIEGILNININATMRVTRMVLPGMVERKRGLILNMGSFSGTGIPSPMLATYAASKAFLSTFTASLAAEVKNQGIDVQCLNTYFVVSNMSKIRKPNMTTPLPKDYVRSALQKIGLACGALWTGRPNVSTPYWSHALLDYLMNLIGWKQLFIGYTHNLHRDIRKRYLRKVARAAKSM